MGAPNDDDDDDPRRLIGRRAELGRLEALRRAGERLVVLVGPVGVGKTALARALARRAREGGAIVHVARVTGASRDEVLFALARAVGIRMVDDPLLALDATAACLDDPRALLVVDGAERHASAVRGVVADLAQAIEGALVVTSRVHLDLPGEVVVGVPPLDEASGARLFRREVARRAPELRLDDAEALATARRLQGIPLAIELAAMRVAKVGVGEGAGLDALGPAPLARVLEASLRALDGESRRDLGALSVFRGGLDLRAASAVLGPGAETRLAALVGASLVLHDAASSRFELLELARPEAERLARASGELAEWQRRHAHHWTSRLEARADDPDAWRVLIHDRDNLLAAFESTLARGEGGAIAAARLAARLDPGLVTSGPAWLHRSVLERAREALSGIDAPDERADLAVALARFHALRGRHGVALAELDAGVGPGVAPARLAWMDALRAFSLRPLGRLDEARSAADRARAVALDLRDAALECAAIQFLGLVDLEVGDLAAAARRFEDALAVARTARAPRLEGIVLANASMTALRAGDVAAGERAAAASRAAFDRVADAFHRVRVDILEGMVALERGDLEGADEIFLVAIGAAVSHGDLDGEVEARTARGQVALRRGDVATARVLLAEALAVVRRTDDTLAARRLEAIAARVERAPSPTLTVARDGARLEIEGRAVDLARRGALRRLAVALARERLERPGSPLDVPRMLAAGWPGERMRPESGAARVYMAVRRLRGLGLGPWLQTRDDGYRLDPTLDVRLVPGREC